MMHLNNILYCNGKRKKHANKDSEIPLLNALTYIKETQDATLTFSAGCRASVCGTCAVRVNGREELSCSYKVKPGDVIEPLQYHPVLRDLKVDKHKAKETVYSVTPATLPALFMQSTQTF